MTATIETLRSRFPDTVRRLWELDRILVEELAPDGSTRVAIDLRARLSAANRKMGASKSRLSNKVPVIDALLGMDAHLEGVTISRLDAWGGNLSNADLERLLETSWMQQVSVLNLGANRLTKKGVDLLTAHPLASSLRDLTLSYNKLGNALTSADFPALESLEVVYCGIDDKALPKLGKARLPALRRLILDAAAAHTTIEKLAKAGQTGELLSQPEYSAKALVAFADGPVAKQLETLGLGNLVIGEPQASVIGDHFPKLKTLTLTGARMSAEAVAALVSGEGLSSLTTLNLSHTFAPAYVDTVRQLPSAATADAMTALATAPFAATLTDLTLDGIVVGATGAQALADGALSALETLEAKGCSLGDDGLAALANGSAPLTTLKLGSNQITATGVRALCDSPLAPRLEVLDLRYNPLRDEGAAALAGCAQLAGLEKLALIGVELTDTGCIALAESPIVNQLLALFLLDNRISDTGAQMLADAEPTRLERLHLGKNCLSEAGVATLRTRLDGVATYLGGQDPNKLPPRVIGNENMRWEPVEDMTKPGKVPVPPSVRERFPYPAWVECDADCSDWAYAMDKSDEGYTVGVVELSSGRAVIAEPPIVNPLPVVGISQDQQWMAVKAFCDDAYVVDLNTGTSTRLGNLLTHRDGGAVFCDGHAVFLDCDTEGDWEGRLDVYGYDGGTWSRQHSIGGFRWVRDGLVPLAKQRLFAVTGRDGCFFCAVRGDQLRFLGYLPVERLDVYDVDGEVVVQIQHRYRYRLANVDAVLDAAFADSESPSTFDLPSR